jgi:ABC-type polysaccharide/polyol phosphate export permease
LIKPLTLTLILYVVFGTIIPVRVPTDAVPYWLHVLVSILTWQFLLGSITEATHSITGHGHLLRKVALDARVFPAAAVLANLVNYVAGLLLVTLVAMPVAGIWPSPVGVLLLIPVVSALALLALTIGLVLAALQVYFRDTASGLELVGTAWFYGSPVIYPLPVALGAIGAALGGWGQWAYLLNPAAPLLAAVRRCTIYPAGAELPDASLALWCAVPVGFCIAALALGSGWFQRASGNFADRL